MNWGHFEDQEEEFGSCGVDPWLCQVPAMVSGGDFLALTPPDSPSSPAGSSTLWSPSVAIGSA